MLTVNKLYELRLLISEKEPDVIALMEVSPKHYIYGKKYI